MSGTRVFLQPKVPMIVFNFVVNPQKDRVAVAVGALFHFTPTVFFHGRFTKSVSFNRSIDKINDSGTSS